MGSLEYVIISLFYSGMVLYVPSISIEAVSGLPYWLVVLLGALVCSMYSTMGGFRAVVWTDVFQVMIMLTLTIILLGFGTHYVGGFGNVWDQLFHSNKANFVLPLRFVENEETRYSIWTLIFLGITVSMTVTFGNQASVQRILCVENVSVAKRSYLLGAWTALFFNMLIVILAIITIIAFSSCDPLKAKLVTGVQSNDDIFAYAATEFFGHVPGLVGLTLVALISASLSTLSSSLNAQAATTLDYFLIPNFPGVFGSSSKRKIWALKILTMLFGTISMLFSFLVPLLGGIVKYTFTLKTSFDAIVATVVITGVFSRHVNAKAMKVGMSLAFLAGTVMVVISGLHKINYESLPHSTIDCPISYNISSSTMNETLPEIKRSKLRQISPLWLAPICSMITFVSACLLSYVIGEHYVPDEALSSPWREKKTKSTEQEKVQLQVTLSDGVKDNTI